jgi:hypothetical protein
MKTSKMMILLILFSGFAFLFFHCGSDPAVEGRNAFEAGDYGLAIKYYLEAKKANPDAQQAYDEKIAISYMKHGEKLYEFKQNVKTFSGNFEKSHEYIPAQPSAEFKTEYSKMLCSLAKAYIAAKPENDIQKEEYLNNSIQYLEDASFNDENNKEAGDLLARIKADNFQKMLNKGNDFYSKAGKTKNNDYYITAEYYFERAADFDIYNQEASAMLSKTRAKTLSILNNREDFAIAIADMNRQPAHLILDLSIKNYATAPVAVDLKKFGIVDKDGNSYAVDPKMMNEKFKDNQLKNQNLAELKLVDGIIVFSIPNKAQIDYLSYQVDEAKTVKKYFP